VPPDYHLHALVTLLLQVGRCLFIRPMCALSSQLTPYLGGAFPYQPPGEAVGSQQLGPNKTILGLKICKRDIKQLEIVTIAPTLLGDYKPHPIWALCGGKQM